MSGNTLLMAILIAHVEAYSDDYFMPENSEGFDGCWRWNGIIYFIYKSSFFTFNLFICHPGNNLHVFLFPFRMSRVCLTLLSAMVAQGPDTARDVFSHFDFNNKFLPGLVKKRDKKVK